MHDGEDDVEAALNQRLGRHGWSLQKRPDEAGRPGEHIYCIVDDADGSIVVGAGYSLNLQDVEMWLD